jgi:hypothetical protein
MDPIRFVAAVQRISTLADGGLRVSFDLPETAIEAVADLMVCKREGVPLLIECKLDDSG